MKKNAGFTLTEALFALSIGIVFLSTVLSVWYFSTKTYKEENARSEMRYGVEVAMEKLKQDIRLSDGNGMLFYPSSAPTYTAVSMPHSYQRATGLYNVSTTISWDWTVLYHIYHTGGKDEFRRTVFTTFNSSASARQTQLNNVVANGSDAAGTTTTLFTADSITIEITPTSPQFDGYNATAALSESTSFGSLQIAAGTHSIRFIITGQNALSSGKRFGLDQLSLSPSGGGQEAEALTVSADNGRGRTTEDMTPYAANGIWNGNYQVEYGSSAVNDYIEFQTYYDQWLESNFANMTHSNTEVTGTNPAVRVSSRESQSLVSAWKADSQTGANPDDNNVQLNTRSIRDIILASSITQGGTMVRFKFMSSATGSLNISSAYFGARNPGTSNFLGTPSQLYFSNSAVDNSDTDGNGAVGAAGPIGISIPQNAHAWTNWIPVTVSNPSATDYLVSFVVPAPLNASDGYETYWKDNGSATHSYLEDGNHPTNDSLASDTGYTGDPSVHAVAEMSTWTSTGTVTSQIYDTKMTAPVFGSLSWTTNGSGSYAFKVRSSSDSQMVGAPAWNTLFSSYSASPAAPSVNSLRYVQWQAAMTTASPYTTYPQIDDVKLQWPGQTAIVDFSGYYTKRPNYGIFTVQVDGQALVNALHIDLTANKTYQSKNYPVSLSTEVRARNTGK